MKVLHFACLLLFLLIITIPCYSRGSAVINRIEGQVFGPQRQPVENARVELENEVNSLVGTTRTSAAGRFTFSGMPGGRYSIKVLPLGTGFLDQTQEVFVTNITPRSSDVAFVEFHLTLDKRNSGTQYTKPPEAVFAQEVPAGAKELYEDALDLLKKDRAAGIAKLEQAVAAFPTYFDALSQLGTELVEQKAYEKAYPFLIRVIDVNPRSASSFYQLGICFYNLKQYPAALEAAKASTTLLPASATGQLLYGTLLRISGKFPEAEATLTKANKLGKGEVAEIHMQLALLYNRLNRNKDAVAELEAYLKLEPNSPEKAKIQGLIAKLQSSDKKN